MFEILDGRKEFYQWDINRKLVIHDETITEVHFCNRTDECSLKCEVYNVDGIYLVDVPNVLLTTDWRINVYGYDKEYTKHSKTFNVVRRSKPEDYIYTEEELKAWEELNERISAIEEDGASVDLSNYYTKEEIEGIIDNLDIDVDLSNYYTKEEVNDLIPDTSGLATEEYVNSAISNIDIPDVEVKDEIFVGTTAPTDENVKVWINPDESLDFPTRSDVYNIVSEQFNKFNSKDWHWVNNQTADTILGIEQDSMLKVVFCNNQNSNDIITLDINTSHGNTFSEESGTTYYTMFYNPATAQAESAWFHNTGSEINISSTGDLTYLGFYYWG